MGKNETVWEKKGLGNPSDARPHYDYSHGIKACLLLSFLFLLAALKQKIWAVTSPTPPTHPPTPPLCWGSAADTGKQSHSLAFPGQNYGQSLPSCEDKSVCVCCLCVHMRVCTHPRTAHTYPMRLSIQCWEPAVAKPPFYWQQPNGGSYFWASLFQNGNTVITALGSDQHRPHHWHNAALKLGSLVARACQRFRDLEILRVHKAVRFL